MAKAIECATVRIFSESQNNNEVIGAGFLVAPEYILTCAHVVAGALGMNWEELPQDAKEPTRAIEVDFPNLRPREGRLRARVEFWRPTEEEDVAVLELLSAPPAQADPIALELKQDVWRHRYKAYGFYYPNGSWTEGIMRSRIANGNVQLDTASGAGHTIAGGFSGTAIWDIKVEAAVGMVVQTDWQQREDGREYPRTAYMIPTSKLCEIYPPLKRYIKGLPPPLPPLPPPTLPSPIPWELRSVKQIRARRYCLLERLQDEVSLPGPVRRHYMAREMDRAGEPHYTWIKQVALHPELAGRAGEKAMAALREEAGLLQELRRQGSGFPAVEELELRPDSVTLVYSCVPGRTLSAVFGQAGKIEKSLSRENTLSLLRAMPELCQQLSRLHQAQRAHRSISPETLLLSSGAKKSVVLRDIGLATEPFRPGEGPTGYAAPEQNHDGYHLPGTDIYQLGGVLYHLLTGRRASSFLDQYQIIPPGRFNRELPQALDTILLKALQQQVQQRWSSIQEFATALQQAMSGFR